MAPGDDLLYSVTAAVVTGAGFDLEDLVVRKGRGRVEVRVVIDRDGGVDADAAAQVSRELARQLDEHGDVAFGGGPYTLQVTSPGASRVLTERRHFSRAAGRLVSLTGADGTQQVARVVGVSGDHLHILGGPQGLSPVTVPLGDISRAAVQVEFSRPSRAVLELLAHQQAVLAHAAPCDDDTGQERDAR